MEIGIAFLAIGDGLAFGDSVETHDRGVQPLSTRILASGAQRDVQVRHIMGEAAATDDQHARLSFS
jgi:hypothetical protein